MTIDQALKLIKTYSCIETKNINSETEKKELQEAILLIVNESDSYNLGICADSSTQAVNTLSNYLRAFGHEIKANNQSVNDMEETVYLKFKITDKSYYIDIYSGNYRGVLISSQSENEKVTGTYGHFPLDLF
jgi:stalled ribosome rescue protein Dom34